MRLPLVTTARFATLFEFALSNCFCHASDYKIISLASNLVSTQFGINSLASKASNRTIKLRCSSQIPPQLQLQNKDKDRFFPLKECAISIAVIVGLLTAVPALAWPSLANAISNPAFPDLGVLIYGPPIKDPGALLCYGLPIDNKAIREVQKPLEDITDSLKIAGLKALDSVERNVRQASRAEKQGKSLIISGLAESKKDHGIELLAKLEVGMDELQKIVEDKKRDAVASKQKELLQYVEGLYM